MGSAGLREGAADGEPAVLLVDDNFGALETLVDILSLKGYRVDAVRSGDEAVAAVRGAAYRMVLMDIQMPGLNGVDALKQMAAHAPEVRVALMTAFTQHQLVDEGLRAGALDVISKPLDIDRVLTLLSIAA